MARFLAQKQLGSLRPVDAAGEEAMRRIKNGATVSVEVKQPRNARHHRLFWALATIVWENSDQDRYPTVEDAVSAIKIAAGHRTRIELPNGVVGFVPKSIAFANMDQVEFSEFYDKVCDVVSRYFLPGVPPGTLKAEVEQMVGIRSAA